MIDTRCAHCGDAYRRDPDEAGPDGYLCEDCAAYTVLGGACPDCGELPSRRLCRDLATHRHYRALR